MDRFAWTSGLLELGETLVVQQRGVRLCDGEEKVTGEALRGAWRRGGGRGRGERARPWAPANGGGWGRDCGWYRARGGLGCRSEMRRFRSGAWQGWAL